MNGYMAEAQKGFATLEEVDADTFGRFVEWAYKGYYNAADFTTTIQDGSDSAGRSTEDERVAEKPFQRTEVPDVEGFGQTSPDQVVYSFDEPFGSGELGSVSPRKRKSEKKVFFPELPDLYTDIPVLMAPPTFSPIQRGNSIKIPPPRRNRNSTEVYRDVFLSHARLYVFAEEYDIQALKSLALDELYVTLANYTLYADRIADIVELLHYVYHNTSEKSEGMEDLRTLMMQYVRREYDTLKHDKDFGDLMMGGERALLGDYITMDRN